ncbi:uncharacterized protein TNCV_2949611 [Trichonephila clavipes]|nr:uncharacterized protein TNCV_2949611 [Trichonephila clavipes]
MYVTPLDKIQLFLNDTAVISGTRRDQEPADFIYNLLKLHKQLELGMSEENLVDHIFVRLEPQVQDYVESEKLEEFGILCRPSNSRNDYRGNYENGRQGNQWFDSRNRFLRDDRRFNDRGYQFRNGGQNDNFSRGDPRNRSSSENFNRNDRRQRGRLNILKVKDDQNDQTQSANEA